MKLNLLLFAICCFSLNVIAQQSYTLKYGFENNKKYNYKMTIDGIVTQTVMGQEMKINTNGTVFTKIETEKVNSDNFALLISLDSAKFHINMPMKDTTSDLGSMVGKRTRFTLFKNGKVLNKELVDSVEGGQNMFAQVSSETTRFIILPDKGIKAGDSWNIENTDSVKMMGGVLTTNSNTDYTLIGKADTLGHSCLKVEFKGKTTSEGKAKIMGMDLVIEGNGKITGAYFFDNDKGLLICSTSQNDSEMTMAATGEQNMIIPISQSIKTVQSLVE
jgi:hypothetical protein